MLCTAPVTPYQNFLYVCIGTWCFSQFQIQVANWLLDINSNTIPPHSNASVPRTLYLLSRLPQINTLPFSRHSGLRFQWSWMPLISPSSPPMPLHYSPSLFFRSNLTSVPSFPFLLLPLQFRTWRHVVQLETWTPAKQIQIPIPLAPRNRARKSHSPGFYLII